MPLEIKSQGFKDISISFQANPLNYDLIAIKNETAISRSLQNLVLTVPGERFFNPTLGSKISSLLFENVDDITASVISDEIESTIKNYEPRVELINVNVNPDYDNNAFDVTIEYKIIGIQAKPQQLTFALEQTR